MKSLSKYIETIVESVFGERFYHASNNDLDIGKTYVARKTKGHFDKKLEKFFESLRPSDKPSRLQSFFLVKSTSMLDMAGGFGSEVYFVSPGFYSKHHFGWLSRAMQLLQGNEGYFDRDRYKANKHLIDTYVKNYWDGKPWKYDKSFDTSGATWEYLAPKIKVIKKL